MLQVMPFLNLWGCILKPELRLVIPIGHLTYLTPMNMFITQNTSI